MKNVRKLIMAAAVAAFTFSAVGCNMVAKTPEAIKKSPLAKFDKVTITKGQLDDRMVGVINQLKAQYGDNYEKNDQAKQILDEQKKQMLDRMITEQLLLQKAQEKKLVPEDAKLKEDVNKQLDDIKKSFNNEDAKYKEAIKQYGYTEDSLKASIKDNIIMGKVTDDITKDVKVDDSKVKEYYDSNQLQFTEKPNRIHVAHILVKTEDEAKKVKERLDKGEDFTKVAKEVSTDTTKDSGGDLGFIEYNDSSFDKTFMTAAISLKEGTISGPVQTSFGWHIIKDIKKEEYPVKSFDAVKDDIKNNLLTTEKQSKLQATIEQWKKDAKIKYYDKNM